MTSVFNTISVVLGILCLSFSVANAQDICVHCDMVTTADPSNYGSELIKAGIGINALLLKNTIILRVEATSPLYQEPNGIQMDQKWGLNTSLRFNAF